MANFTSSPATLLANGDTLTLQVNGRTWVHIDGTFNSGNAALTYQDTNGVSHAIRDSSGVAVAYTAAADDFYMFPANAKIVFTVAGAAGATAIFIQVQSEPSR